MSGQSINKQVEAVSTQGWRKDKVFATALALVFGLLGGHHFYLGNTRKGVLYLLLTVLLCWTIVVPSVLYIICVVESLSYFTASDTDFDNEFNNHQVMS